MRFEISQKADHFAFASFFPRVFRGPIGFFSDMVYKILIKLKICSKVVKKNPSWNLFLIRQPISMMWQHQQISQLVFRELQKLMRREDERKVFKVYFWNWCSIIFSKALAVLSQKLKSVETQDEAWSDDEPAKTEESTAVTIEEPEKSTPAQPTPEE